MYTIPSSGRYWNFFELKDRLFHIINAWKNSDDVIYTRGVNLKTPINPVVESWIQGSWNTVSVSNIQNSIKPAGFSGVANNWHIAKKMVMVTNS